MPSSVMEMLAEANAAVPRLNPAEVRDMIGKGDVLFVDVRDALELATGGQLKGAINASRGMLESPADPDSPFHSPAFQKDKTVLVYCGWAAACIQRQDLEGSRLPIRLQRRRLHGAGRSRPRNRAGLDCPSPSRFAGLSLSPLKAG
jgi:hypothetical protein